MTEKQPPSVIVGIDGSRAAIRAAEWAAPEAVSLDVPLRLVFVIDSDAPYGADGIEREFARDSLAAAHEAVLATGHPVKIETEIVEGHLVKTLIGMTHSAEMMCVGSVGIGYFTDKLLGSVAAELARSAHCPVAIIRPEENSVPGDDWIAVVVDDAPSSEFAIETAVREAQLCGTGVLALRVWRHRLGIRLDGDALAEGNRRAHEQLEIRLAPWRKNHPEVRFHAVATHNSAHAYLADNRESVRLVIVGRALAGDAQRFIGPVGHALTHHAKCSVLVIG